MRKISELTGDSTVIDVVFDSGQVKFRFEDRHRDEESFVTGPTRGLYSVGSSEFDCVSIRIVELKAVLPIERESQIYVAPQDFGAVMQAAR